MKLKDIHKAFSTLNACSDFITNACDSDESNIGSEMLEGLKALTEALQVDQCKIFYKSARAKILKRNKIWKR